MIGNGQRVKFWKTLGLELSLYVSLPNLYALADSKQAWVRDYWSDPIDGGG